MRRRYSATICAATGRTGVHGLGGQQDGEIGKELRSEPTATRLGTRRGCHASSTASAVRGFRRSTAQPAPDWARWRPTKVEPVRRRWRGSRKTAVVEIAVVGLRCLEGVETPFSGSGCPTSRLSRAKRIDAIPRRDQRRSRRFRPSARRHIRALRAAADIACRQFDAAAAYPQKVSAKSYDGWLCAYQRRRCWT